MKSSVFYKAVPKGELPHVESARLANNIAFEATIKSKSWPYRVQFGSLEWRIAQRKFEATQATLDAAKAAEDAAFSSKRFTYHIVEYPKTRPARGADRRRAIADQLCD